jgi:hypothetical protein
MTTDKKYRLRFSHKDFICKQLALFKPHRDVALELLKKYPGIPLSVDELVTRVEYYASTKRTHKWRNRIIQYRRMMEYEFPNRFRLANKHQRMMELERIFSDAMTPKLRRVIWFPVSKTPKGEIIYNHKEVYEPDLSAAINVLTTIPRELDDLSFSHYPPPAPIRKSLSPEQVFDALGKYLKDLDLTFGIK